MLPLLPLLIACASDPIPEVALPVDPPAEFVATAAPDAVVELPLPSSFSWVSPKLAGTAEPRGDDLAALAAAGVVHVITLTEDPLPEAELTAAGLKSWHVPIEDMHAPELEQLDELVAGIDKALASDEPVAVHCLAGLGRTGTVLATWFVSQGMSADEAMAQVRRLRPGSIEAESQEQVIREWAESRR